MGWMHDTLQYFERDPIHRGHHQDELTFRALYGFTENYVLPLSHDEVVHGKGSLLGRMPGDQWQRLANLRLLYGYQWTVPGKKLLFMGGEFGQESEWSHEKSLDWHLLQDPGHAGVERWVADLNRAYAAVPGLHERDADPGGFEWVDTRDHANSVLSFLRRGRTGGDVLVIFNFTPVTRENYRVGVPRRGHWREVLNSDATEYGGSGVGNLGGVNATPVPTHGRTRSVNVTLPPLGVIVLESESEGDGERDGESESESESGDR
jgi:1,4-alpha-glucan branching enzyme